MRRGTVKKKLKPHKIMNSRNLKRNALAEKKRQQYLPQTIQRLILLLLHLPLFLPQWSSLVSHQKSLGHPGRPLPLLLHLPLYLPQWWSLVSRQTSLGHPGRPLPLLLHLPLNLPHWSSLVSSQTSLGHPGRPLPLLLPLPIPIPSHQGLLPMLLPLLPK